MEAIAKNITDLIKQNHIAGVEKYLDFYLQTIEEGTELEQVNAMVKLGEFYLQSKRHDIARQVLEDALDHSYTNGDMKIKADIHYYLGMNFRLEGNLKDAHRHLSQAKKMAISLEENTRLIETYIEIALRYLDEPKKEQAIAALESANSIAVLEAKEFYIYKTYQMMGNVYEDKNDPHSAILAYEKALESLDSESFIVERTGISRKLSVIYWSLNKGSQALKYADRSLREAKETRIATEINKALFQLTKIQAELGSFDQALKNTDALVLFYEKNSDHNSLASTFNLIGYIHLKRNQVSEARKYFEKVLSIDMTIVKPLIRAYALEELSRILFESSENAVSLEFANQARAIYTDLALQQNLTSVNILIADIYADGGSYDKALVLLNAALWRANKIKDALLQSEVLIKQAKIEIITDKNKARTMALKSLNIARNISSRPLQAEALKVLMDIESKVLNFKVAHEYLVEISDIEKEEDSATIARKIANLRQAHSVEQRDMELETLKQKSKIDELGIISQQSEIDILKHKKAISELDVYKDKILKTISASVLFVTLIVLVFVGCFLYLSRRNRAFEQEKSNYIASNSEQLAQLHHDKLELFKGMARELEGPINGMDNIFKTFEGYVEENDRASVIVTLDLIKATIAEAQQIGDDMVSCDWLIEDKQVQG